MVTDSIADMLVRIKNAGNAGHVSVFVPFSGVRMNIANLLKKEGYVDAVKKTSRNAGKRTEDGIEIMLLYEGKRSHIEGVSRISRPSQRIYIGVRNIKPIRNGHGMLVLSTPKGILSDNQARKEHVGGEVLFKIW